METRMLSPLGMMCLRWVSQCRTIAEIALLEGTTANKIEKSLETALLTLEAKAATEALAKVRQ
ncbi:DNA-binding CsgD family transcriptional regulator [Rhizobium sp. BK077]|uniref:LuxR family transcriptional regulator n=1 Tax=Rhizobium sp. BK008 TaxID=2587094 RepID=UPI001617612B|nr:LuxR family transcriptional regulator [Rhizobium sp. BK008]MBB3302214.1 DNA-binding CsgD family transcriptional regulator [Rhizobium sp. BK112]MBB3371336.1 DNA-binding CsgD family transcriptional regulator [Rhizobium sp. BK077]MBB4182176.1 DNA-binding CsgD family transcriptional regulator [Rhizobium sp. BK109]MBB4255605.1 DNA-binding CsgD family transcriptional regulator [Rhizobium sp. BK008]